MAKPIKPINLGAQNQVTNLGNKPVRRLPSWATCFSRSAIPRAIAAEVLRNQRACLWRRGSGGVCATVSARLEKNPKVFGLVHYVTSAISLWLKQYKERKIDCKQQPPVQNMEI